MIKDCGIYRLVFPSGKSYIGSSTNMEVRKRYHSWSCKGQRHINSIVQKAWNKYQEFVFERLIYCKSELLMFYEQLLIDKLEPEYNITKVVEAPMRGRFHTEESKSKMREFRSTPEARKLQSDRMKERGKFVRTAQGIENLRYTHATAILCVETGRTFRSSRDAALWIAATTPTIKLVNYTVNIRCAARNHHLTAYGYHWRKVS